MGDGNNILQVIKLRRKPPFSRTKTVETFTLLIRLCTNIENVLLICNKSMYSEWK